MSLDLRTVILRPTPDVSYHDFISFWSEQYNYPDQEKYTGTLAKETFTVDDLYVLFIWKNGMALSKKKQGSFDRIAVRVDLVNKLRSRFNLDKFNQEFGWMTLIWKVFLLHTINPVQFPIFDQHVNRAFGYLIEKQPRDGKIETFSEYLDLYVPFYHSLHEQCLDHTPKQIDEALWAFGKAMSIYPRMFT